MTIDYDRILTSLKAGDEDAQRDALRQLGVETQSAPPDDVIDAAILLLEHGDEDVRYEAAFAVGLHWSSERAFEPLLQCLRRERSEAAVEVILRSLGLYCASASTHLIPAQRELAKLVQDRTRSLPLRGLAYATLLQTRGQVQLVSEELEQHAVDWAWLQQLTESPS